MASKTVRAPCFILMAAPMREISQIQYRLDRAPKLGGMVLFWSVINTSVSSKTTCLTVKAVILTPMAAFILEVSQIT